MEKLAVVTNGDNTKTASQTKRCPRCGSKAEVLGRVIRCPLCGTEPFEHDSSDPEQD